MADQDKESGGPGAVSRVVFEYIKNSNFRVVHVDGVIGGITPAGNIHIAVFSERPAIPRQIVAAVDIKGQIGSYIDTETIVRGGMIREMDVDLMMSLPVAEALVTWLNARIDELKTQSKPVGGDTK